MMSTYIHYSTGFVSDNVQTLLDTMTEISSILYSRPEKCCQKSILRLHNQTFLHDIACEEVIGRPQVLSEKKFYGRYFHSLVVHTPIQHRIVCQVNKHRAARTSLQCLFKYLSSNIKQKTR